MKQSFGVSLIAVMLVYQINAFSHGEDRTGPHGGFVRMPGGFHTELVKVDDQRFNVYLLDFNWRNPSTVKSSVEATLKSEGRDVQISCNPNESFFSCIVRPPLSISGSKKILIKAVREGKLGGVVSYDLPLKVREVAK